MSEDRIIRIGGVKGKVGMPTSSVYAEISKGTFPKPIKLSARRVGWIEREIDEWVAARIAESREEKPREREPKKAAQKPNKRSE